MRGAPMAGRSVTVELPDDLYERLTRQAAEARRSVAAEVVQVLTAAVATDDDALPRALQDELARMRSLADDALERAARPAFTPRMSKRLEALHFKVQSEGLTEDERREEHELVGQYRRAMLIRAQALALLKQRGRDISALLAPV